MYKNAPTKNVSKSYGGSKSSSFAMKNSMLRKGSMHKTPMQMNYGPMKNTTELEAKGKKVIINTPVSGSQQVKNLEKYKELGKNDPEYRKTLNLSKQREQSEKEDSGKA